MIHTQETIVALSTGQPSDGAIAVIRLSGAQALPISLRVFRPISPKKWKGYQSRFGSIHHEDKWLDDAIASYYPSPHSYTGEDVIELSLHSSPYIVSQTLQALITEGARLAEPGEFTFRRFLHGKMDLSQAEAVADLIASDSKAQHEIALHQMRGGFSTELQQLREQLINFMALIELELDFSEEDVEFVDRQELIDLIHNLKQKIKNLISSFDYGNAIKEGIPVAIIGKPNAGKSSLLNALLNEDKAIVSDIPGTTRDTIEDTLVIDGTKFRFIDTAGIRQTEDQIEALGVQRALDKASDSKIILYIFARDESSPQEVIEALKELHKDGQIIILLENKIDLQEAFTENPYSPQIIEELSAKSISSSYQAISTMDPLSIQSVKSILAKEAKEMSQSMSTIVTNQRHKQSLEKSLQSLETVSAGLHSDLSGDLLSMDIREALHHLGEITGEIEIDRDILGTIFGKFCIGK